MVEPITSMKMTPPFQTAENTDNLNSNRKQFWLVLMLVWGSFGLLNFIFRVYNKLDTLELGAISALIFVSVNVMCCALMMRFINWLSTGRLSGWFYALSILIVIALASLFSTALLLYTLSFYLFLRGLIPEISMNIGSLSGNAIIVFLLMLFWVVTEKLIRFTQKNKALKKQQQETLLELKDAQLNLLTGQLNPHFLFNGLNNIRSLILEDAQMARTMITALSEILRYGLNSHKDSWVTLKSELEVVQNYMALAKIQYENRLDFQQHTDAALDDMLMPPMMIQLLIENAIRHGVYANPMGSQLVLTVRSKHNTLEITVVNPGSLTKPFHKEQSTGLGLVNIKKRLQLLFGDEASLQVTEDDSRLQKQVKAVLILPVIRGAL